MFGRYDTCQTVNKPVRDAVYYRLKSIQRRAVRPGLVSPDWETNLYFCGVVNKYQNNHSHEAALGVIHKRLIAGLRRVKRSNRITYLSLILLETCMKNCGTRFHYVAADEALFKTLLRLARPRISGKRMFGVSSSGNYMRDLMEERVLLLIQAWGKAFSDRTNGRMSLYSHHYSQLRSKGVRFPPERPEDEVFSKQEKEAQGRSSRNTQMDEEEVKSILNPLKESMDVLEEMLNSLGPRDNPEKDPVIQSLVSLCKEAKPRVIKLIDKCVDNEHLTEFLMNTFDRLEELLSQHEIKCGRTAGARPLKYETSRPSREGGAPRSGKSSKSSRGKQDDSDYSSDDSDDDDGEENYDDESDDDDYLRGSNKGGNVPKEKKGSFGTLSRKRSTSLPPRVQQNPASPSQQQLQQHYQQHQQQQQQQRATQNMSAPFAPVAYQQPLYGATPQPQAVPGGAQDDYHQQQLQLQQQMQRLQIQQQQQQQLQQALAQSPASPLSPRGTGGYTSGQFAGQPGSQGQPQRVMDVGRMSTDDFNRLAAQGFKTMDPAAGRVGQPSPMSPFSASAPSIPYAGPISPPHSAGSQPGHPQQQQLQQQQQYALYQQQLAQQQHLQQQQLLQQQQQQLWSQQQPGSQGQQWQPQTLAQPSSSHGSFSLIDSDLDFLASVGSGKGQMPQQYQQQHSLGLKSNLTSSLPTLPSMDYQQQQQYAPYGGPGAYQRSASVASGLPPPPAAHRSRTNSRNGQAQ